MPKKPSSWTCLHYLTADMLSTEGEVISEDMRCPYCYAYAFLPGFSSLVDALYMARWGDDTEFAGERIEFAMETADERLGAVAKVVVRQQAEGEASEQGQW